MTKLVLSARRIFKAGLHLFLALTLWAIFSGEYYLFGFSRLCFLGGSSSYVRPIVFI